MICTKHQDKVFRARRRSELLQELVQDLESMAHKAYPGASPGLLMVLIYNQFIDALDIPQLKIQVKEAKSASM